jgi:thymidylate synthase (FAD)
MTTVVEIFGKDNELKPNNYVRVLDHGFVGLVDVMGTDNSVVQAARVSYGDGTKSVSDDTTLIRYLLRHEHGTPFEMCELKFHIKCPILTIRQLIRHRVANINEQSGRYSKLTEEFYMPDFDVIQPQSKDNKQGRSGDMSLKNKKGVQWLMQTTYDNSYKSYRLLLGEKNEELDEYYDVYGSDSILDDDFTGVAKELARSVMPVGGYTEFYWKMDLRNLFGFLKLRLDSHAQYEIRVFGEAIASYVKEKFPISYKACEDYVLNAYKVSSMEKNMLKSILEKYNVTKDDISQIGISFGMTKREIVDFNKEFFK